MLLRVKSKCSLSLNFVSLAKHMLHKILHINYQRSTLHIADTWWWYAWNPLYTFVYEYLCKNVVCTFKCAFHSDNSNNFGIFHVHFWLCATRSNECMENRCTRHLFTIWMEHGYTVHITSYRHSLKSCKLLIKFETFLFSIYAYASP